MNLLFQHPQNLQHAMRIYASVLRDQLHKLLHLPVINATLKCYKVVQSEFRHWYDTLGTEFGHGAGPEEQALQVFGIGREHANGRTASDIAKDLLVKLHHCEVAFKRNPHI